MSYNQCLINMINPKFKIFRQNIFRHFVKIIFNKFIQEETEIIVA